MSNDGHSSSKKEPNSQKKLIVIIVALVILLIVGAIVIFFLLNQEPERDDVSAGRGTVITKDNVDEVMNEEPVQDGYYTTSMSLDWHFNGTVSEDAYVANVPENTRTVYFDLFRVDTNEMIYSSPYIPVGAELKGVTLDTELDPGTYETILVYHLVDDDENELSTLSIALTIYVE